MDILEATGHFAKVDMRVILIDKYQTHLGLTSSPSSNFDEFKTLIIGPTNFIFWYLQYISQRMISATISPIAIIQLVCLVQERRFPASFNCVAFAM